MTPKLQWMSCRHLLSSLALWLRLHTKAPVDVLKAAPKLARDKAAWCEDWVQWREKEWQKNPDRIKILGLPANFDQLNQKSKCAWLKKSYKKMVLKWHPDKNKGNPERGRRKFEEVQVAKKAMAQQLGCRQRRRL